jgi:hypothetical protein
MALLTPVPDGGYNYGSNSYGGGGSGGGGFMPGEMNSPAGGKVFYSLFSVSISRVRASMSYASPLVSNKAAISDHTHRLMKEALLTCTNPGRQQQRHPSSDHSQTSPRCLTTIPRSRLPD